MLGSLLFLLCINAIHVAVVNLSFYLFADDTCLLYLLKDTGHCEPQANEGLENVSNWLTGNKLILNEKKSNLIFYNITRKTQKNRSNDSFKTSQTQR